MTGGPSASLSSNKAPIWGLRLDFYHCQIVSGLLIWGALSDERTGLSFTISARSRQRSHSRVRVPWDLRPYFTVSDLRLPFLSPPTSRRFTVEVVDPAPTRKSNCNSQNLSLSLILRPMVSQPVCLRIKHPSGAYDQIFITVRQLRVCSYGARALSDERTGLSFTIAAGPRRRSHSRVRVPWYWRPYFTVSDLRLPFLSPPTTRRATVEVFDPASTRD
jgi:hypothetical protein